MTHLRHDVAEVGRHFDIAGHYEGSAPCGSGHINDTYAATYREGDTLHHVVHQRINHAIFRDPAAMMDNIARVTRHVQARLEREPGSDPARENMILVPTREGAFYHVDVSGHYWRTYRLIEGARSFDTISSPEQAYQAARAFGRFQERLSDLGGPRLHETIPAFHHTPLRYEAFATARMRDVQGRAMEATAEIAFAERHQKLAHVLLDLHEQGLAPERVTHNDTKINNVLLDEKTGRGLCVIDLDTVMPGLSLYDFGDLVRTATCSAAEDERDLSLVILQLPLFEALVRGYLETAGATLTQAEIEHLPEAGMLITYETGLRFLTDHLAGDTYFKIHRPGHNLDRCRTQFALVAQLKKHRDDLHAIVARHTRL
jgi:Ser/Thr protein kinase RdoA (MazF antagonist)